MAWSETVGLPQRRILAAAITYLNNPEAVPLLMEP